MMRFLGKNEGSLFNRRYPWRRRRRFLNSLIGTLSSQDGNAKEDFD